MRSSGSATARVASLPPISRAPVYFGPADRPLFGWYHTPASRAANDLAAVICPSVGHEYANAHRTLRHLADAFARHGIPTLRFDYDGTGDSAGDENDPDRVAAWLASIRAALDAVRRSSGRDRAVLVGFRLGATLAATVAQETALAGLVLWAPCLHGAGFLRELRVLSLASRSSEAGAAPCAIEAGGFLATPALQQEIKSLDLRQIAPKAQRVLIADRTDLPCAASLAREWSGQGVAVERRLVDGFAGMIAAPHNAVVPTATIAAIAEWIAADAKLVLQASPADRALATDRRITVVDFRESVLRFGPGGATFGILTEPTALPRPDVPTVILSNAGCVHHVGPNGLYVRLARTLSRAGFRVLRFDLPGLGDSTGDEAVPENIPYPPNASAMLATAMKAVKARYGETRFVLMGLCSGAHASFHAAVDLTSHPVVEAVLINPLTFAYRPGLSLDAPSAPHADRWQRYRKAMRTRRGWAKLFRSDVPVFQILRDVLSRVAFVLGLRRPSAKRSALDRELRSVAQNHRRLTLVCSRYDPGHDLLMLEAGRTARALKRAGTLDTWFIDGANHTFDEAQGRAAVIASITDALRRRYTA